MGGCTASSDSCTTLERGCHPRALHDERQLPHDARDLLHEMPWLVHDRRRPDRSSIPPVVHVDTRDGLVFIDMELVNRETLDAICGCLQRTVGRTA